MAYSRADFDRDLLNGHNRYRQDHQSPPLQLDPKISRDAQAWADHLASRNLFQHSDNKQYGENIASNWSSSGKEHSGQEVADMWYSEVKKFNFTNNTYTSGTGHFTQMVWKGSRKCGFGKAKTADGRVLIVANYEPRGNMMGAFKENVFPARR